MPYKNILLTLAGKDEEAPVIKEAARVASACGARLKVVHVNDPDAGKMSMMMPGEGRRFGVDEIEALFKKFAGNESIAAKASFEIITSHSVPEAIEKESGAFDLVILGHKHMNALEENLRDSEDQVIKNRLAKPSLSVRYK